MSHLLTNQSSRRGTVTGQSKAFSLHLFESLNLADHLLNPLLGLVRRENVRLRLINSPLDFFIAQLRAQFIGERLLCEFLFYLHLKVPHSFLGLFVCKHDGLPFLETYFVPASLSIWELRQAKLSAVWLPHNVALLSLLLQLAQV